MLFNRLIRSGITKFGVASKQTRIHGVSPCNLLIKPAESIRYSSNLSELLKRELQEEKANCFMNDELSDLHKHIQSIMTIEEETGNMEVLLKSQYQNENIEVRFNSEDVIDADEEEFEGDEEIEESESSEEDIIPSIEFSVKISRDSEALIFDCLASDILTVEKVSHTFQPSETIETEYSGPTFEDLEEDVQEEFLQYLAERNIDDKLASFICQYSDLKEQQEYVTFLDNAVKFIK